LSSADFPNLEVLNLAYNKVSRSSLQSLYLLNKLRVMDLTANSLRDVPHDFAKFSVLEELNLAGNELDSASSTIQNTFKYLGQLPHLKRLNLSRNRLNGFHSDALNPQVDF